MMQNYAITFRETLFSTSFYKQVPHNMLRSFFDNYNIKLYIN